MRANEMKTGKAFTTRLLLSNLLLILLLCWANVSAQDQKAPNRGFTPGGSYAFGDIETINATNGNLMLNIPVAVLPPGRGGLSAKISLFYNSKLYDPRTIYRDCSRTPYGAPMAPEEPAGPQCSGDAVARAVIVARNPEVGGWRYGYKYKIELEGRNYYPPTQTNTNYYNPCQDYDYLYYFKLFVTFPDGSKHEFRLLDKDERDGYYKYRPDGATNGWNPSTNQGYCPSDAPLNTKMVYYSTDGTYARLEFEQDGDHNDWSNNPWTLYLHDGTRVTGGNSPQRVIDRNGNYIEIQEHVPYNSNYADKIVDQLGRAIVIEYDGATGDDRIHQWGTGGLEIITTVKWKTIQVSKTYNAGSGSIGTTLNPTFHVIDQIVLPQQAGSLSYTFGYNAGTSSSSGWGELSSVTLPSGASTAYSYKLDGQTGSTITAMDVVNNSPTQKVLTYRQEYDGVPQSNTPCVAGSSNCATETWTYSIPEYEEGGTTTITGPDGGVSKESFYGGTGYVYKSERPDGTLVERQWLNNVPNSASTAEQEFNSYVKAEMTSITNAAGNPIMSVVKSYQYDKNGNLLKTSESDWQSYSSLHDGGGNPLWASVPSVQFARTTLNTYYLDAPEASESNVTDPRNANVYNRDTAPRLLNAVKSTELRAGSEDGAKIARTEFVYDNSLTTGNLTEQKSWDSTKGAYSNPLSQTNSISVAQQYDSYGNVTLKTDPRGIQTKYTYAAVNGFTNLYPTQTEVAYGTALKRTFAQEYDFSTGAVTRATDIDNNVSNLTQCDIFGRPILVKVAEGTILETQTVTVYSDTARRVITRSDLNASADWKLVSIKHFDQMGRVRLTRLLEDASIESETDETKGIKVQTRYMVSGSNSYQLVSNPYRMDYATQTSTEPTLGWRRSKSDQAGRILEVQTFAGNTLPAPWGTNTNSTGTITTSYDGPSTTVTDQSQKTRKSEVDGFNRIIKVNEDPAGLNFETTYAYDVQGNLTGVTQSSPLATQTRTFIYSSLSRLTSAENPESGRIDYQYDANGNLVLKIDPRTGGTALTNCSIPYNGNHIATCYEYDALSRPTSRTYNDQGATPNVTYTYDTLVNGKGRLTSVSSSVSATTVTQYDLLGRVRASQQQIQGIQQPYTFEYSYNLAGSVVSEKYPSGRVVATDYDSAGRIIGVKNQATNSYYAGAGTAQQDEANRIKYTAGGAISAVKLGNGLWEHILYNSRLQPTEIGLGTSSSDSSKLKLGYKYGVVIGGTPDETKNNGNLQSQSISMPGANSTTLTLSQDYEYDQLNRLKKFHEAGANQNWYQYFKYDRFGNRNIDTALQADNTQTSSGSLFQGENPSINPADNRINAAGYEYDAAGNLKKTPGAKSFVYDAENKQISYKESDVEKASYFYDGEGKRVKKVVGGVTTIYIYDIAGRLIAEYGGEVVNNGTRYLTADHLSSTRVVTDAGGAVKERHDYLPFGAEIGSDGLDVSGRGSVGQQDYRVGDTRQKFTGKERDIETGLDYFNARYYSSGQGRFMSIDSGPFMPAAPQNWNRYSFVENNPLKFIDPTGRKLELGGPSAQDFVDYLKKRSGGLDLLLKDGKVRIGKDSADAKTSAEKAFRAFIKGIINASETVKLDVERDAPNNFVDDTVSARNENRRAVLDMDDIEAIDGQAPALAAALTAHVLYEGLRFAQGSASDVGEPLKYGFKDIKAGAHINALAVEAGIMSAFTGQDEGKIAEHRDKDLQTQGVLNFIYTTVQFDVTVKSTGRQNSIAVDKVTQTTPVRSPGWPPGQ